VRGPVFGQVARFALVGVINTATYYGIYLLLRVPLGYLGAHVIAFALSTVGSYLLNTYFTYRTRPSWRTFALFPLTVAGNFVITTVGVTLLVEVAAMDERVAPLVAAAVAIPVTFFATRFLLLGRQVEAG
jgi:putative flippase GtrA